MYKIWTSGDDVMIEDGANGSVILTKDAIAAIAAEVNPPVAADEPTITEPVVLSWKEQLADLIGMGASNKFIAEKFGVSTATVGNERRRQGLGARKWTDQQRANFKATRWGGRAAAE